MEILELVCEGFNNKEIANMLCISYHTVKSHISNIIYKFEAKNRTQVAYIAAKENIINKTSI